MKNKTNYLSCLLAFVLAFSFPLDSQAGPRSGGGKPASKSSSPSKSPSRSSSSSSSSKSTASKPPPPASKPVASKSRSSSSGKPANPTVSSKPTKSVQSKTESVSKPIPHANVTGSSGRNSSLKPKNTPASVAVSGETRARPTSANATSSGRNASVAKSSSSPPKISSSDKALYERAKQSGTVFSSRAEAAASFQKQYEKEFSAKFEKEPASRPAYIPPAYTTPKGTKTTVVYNPEYKGYGYWSGGGPNLGDFILYNILADEAMSKRVMAQKGYTVEDPSSSGHGWLVLFILLGVIAVVVVIVIVKAR